jgi:hypothetical protein
MTVTKDITVNGVKLRLKKLGAFKQQEVFDKYLFPVIGCIGDSYKAGLDNAEILAKLPSLVQEKLPPAERKALIFDVLLSPDCVKLVAEGIELDLITNVNGVRSFNSQALDDIAFVWQIAIESFKFNYSNLFTSAQTFLAQMFRSIRD